MTNVTNVTTQSGAIRTLTAEELTVVSGGLTPQQFAALEGGYAWGNLNKYFPQPQYTYTPYYAGGGGWSGVGWGARSTQ